MTKEVKIVKDEVISKRFRTELRVKILKIIARPAVHQCLKQSNSVDFTMCFLMQIIIFFIYKQNLNYKYQISK